MDQTHVHEAAIRHPVKLCLVFQHSEQRPHHNTNSLFRPGPPQQPQGSPGQQELLKPAAHQDHFWRLGFSSTCCPCSKDASCQPTELPEQPLLVESEPSYYKYGEAKRLGQRCLTGRLRKEEILKSGPGKRKGILKPRQRLQDCISGKLIQKSGKTLMFSFCN